MSGRVEIFYDGEWGTVCDEGWSKAEAIIVCSQLGLANYGRAINGDVLGRGSGRVWLSELNCEGHELSLDMCVNGGWGKNSCEHDRDAGVVCAGYEGR